jgi:hypothetical protein
MSDQNELSESYKLGVDIRPREAELVGVARDDLGFEPKENGLLGYSTWWNSERAGAFRYAGTYAGKAAILKVQGVEPNVSEITALEAFKAANRSGLVRPPELYASIPWDEERQFEALVVETIESDKLINYPTSEQEVAQFFTLFKDYRKNCRSQPWIDEPSTTLTEDTRRTVASNLKTANELYPNHPHRKSSDFALIEQGLQILEGHYAGMSREFQHLHITSDDVFLPSGTDTRHIYTSNFVWGWKAPFFDATAAYHHYGRLLCERAPSVDGEALEKQTHLWEREMYTLVTTDNEKIQLDLAMLGQLIGCLSISDLTINPDHPLARNLIDLTRQKLARLIKQLN